MPDHASAKALAENNARTLHEEGGVLDQLGDLRKDLEAHEVKDNDRHGLVMELLKEIRANQDKTVGAYLWQLGADYVPIPMAGKIRVRSLLILLASTGLAGYFGVDWRALWGAPSAVAVEHRPLPAPTETDGAPAP